MSATVVGSSALRGGAVDERAAASAVRAVRDLRRSKSTIEARLAAARSALDSEIAVLVALQRNAAAGQALVAAGSASSSVVVRSTAGDFARTGATKSAAAIAAQQRTVAAAAAAVKALESEASGIDVDLARASDAASRTGATLAVLADRAATTASAAVEFETAAADHAVLKSALTLAAEEAAAAAAADKRQGQLAAARAAHHGAAARTAGVAAAQATVSAAAAAIADRALQQHAGAVVRLAESIQTDRTRTAAVQGARAAAAATTAAERAGEYSTLLHAGRNPHEAWRRAEVEAATTGAVAAAGKARAGERLRAAGAVLDDEQRVMRATARVARSSDALAADAAARAPSQRAFAEGRTTAFLQDVLEGGRETMAAAGADAATAAAASGGSDGHHPIFSPVTGAAFPSAVTTAVAPAALGTGKLAKTRPDLLATLAARAGVTLADATGNPLLRMTGGLAPPPALTALGAGQLVGPDGLPVVPPPEYDGDEEGVEEAEAAGERLLIATAHAAAGTTTATTTTGTGTGILRAGTTVLEKRQAAAALGAHRTRVLASGGVSATDARVPKTISTLAMGAASSSSSSSGGPPTSLCPLLSSPANLHYADVNAPSSSSSSSSSTSPLVTYTRDLTITNGGLSFVSLALLPLHDATRDLFRVRWVPPHVPPLASTLAGDDDDGGDSGGGGAGTRFAQPDDPSALASEPAGGWGYTPGRLVTGGSARLRVTFTPRQAVDIGPSPAAVITIRTSYGIPLVIPLSAALPRALPRLVGTGEPPLASIQQQQAAAAAAIRKAGAAVGTGTPAEVAAVLVAAAATAASAEAGGDATGATGKAGAPPLDAVVVARLSSSSFAPFPPPPPPRAVATTLTFPLAKPLAAAPPTLGTFLVQLPPAVLGEASSQTITLANDGAVGVAVAAVPLPPGAVGAATDAEATGAGAAGDRDHDDSGAAWGVEADAVALWRERAATTSTATAAVPTDGDDASAALPGYTLAATPTHPPDASASDSGGHPHAPFTVSLPEAHWPLPPFTRRCTSMTVTFSPLAAGRQCAAFRLRFTRGSGSGGGAPTVVATATVVAVSTGISLPLYLPHPLVDLRIMMTGRSYRATVAVRNRGKRGMRVAPRYVGASASESGSGTDSDLSAAFAACLAWTPADAPRAPQAAAVAVPAPAAGDAGAPAAGGDGDGDVSASAAVDSDGKHADGGDDGGATGGSMPGTDGTVAVATQADSTNVAPVAAPALVPLAPRAACGAEVNVLAAMQLRAAPLAGAATQQLQGQQQHQQQDGAYAYSLRMTPTRALWAALQRAHASAQAVTRVGHDDDASSLSFTASSSLSLPFAVRFDFLSPDQALPVPLTVVGRLTAPALLVADHDAAGVGAPAAALAPTAATSTSSRGGHAHACSLDFGTMPVGQAIAKPVTVTNACALPQIVTATPTGHGAGSVSLRFDSGAEAATLMPGESVPATVVVTPAASGAGSAAVRLSTSLGCASADTDDGDALTALDATSGSSGASAAAATIDCTWTAVPPLISLSHASLLLAPVAPGQVATTTITVTGKCPSGADVEFAAPPTAVHATGATTGGLGAASPSPSAADGACFTVTPPVIRGLAMGDTARVVVEYAPPPLPVPAPVSGSGGDADPPAVGGDATAVHALWRLIAYARPSPDALTATRQQQRPDAATGGVNAGVVHHRYAVSIATTTTAPSFVVTAVAGADAAPHTGTAAASPASTAPPVTSAPAAVAPVSLGGGDTAAAAASTTTTSHHQEQQQRQLVPVDAVAFGCIAVTSSASRSLRVTNVTRRALLITCTIQGDASEALTLAGPSTVAVPPGGSAPLGFTFTPLEPRLYTGSIMISDGGRTAGAMAGGGGVGGAASAVQVVVPWRGEGARPTLQVVVPAPPTAPAAAPPAAAAASLPPAPPTATTLAAVAALDFDACVVGDRAAKTVTLRNTSSFPVTYTLERLPPVGTLPAYDAAPLPLFTLEPAGGTVPAGATTTLTCIFAPTVPPPDLAVLRQEWRVRVPGQPPEGATRIAASGRPVPRSAFVLPHTPNVTLALAGEGVGGGTGGSGASPLPPPSPLHGAAGAASASASGGHAPLTFAVDFGLCAGGVPATAAVAILPVNRSGRLLPGGVAATDGAAAAAGAATAGGKPAAGGGKPGGGKGGDASLGGAASGDAVSVEVALKAAAGHLKPSPLFAVETSPPAAAAAAATATAGGAASAMQVAVVVGGAGASPVTVTVKFTPPAVVSDVLAAFTTPPAVAAAVRAGHGADEEGGGEEHGGIVYGQVVHRAVVELKLSGGHVGPGQPASEVVTLHLRARCRPQ